MAISGISIAISDREPDRSRAKNALSRLPELTLGPEKGHRIAAVLETPSPREDVRVVRQIQAVPGVLSVDVVAVFYEEEMTASSLGDFAGEAE